MRAYNSDITVEEFIARHDKPYDSVTDNYFREPFAQDTKVGRNSAIYNAHSFHTKVPPEGIVPYILHYTEPGDLILDPFAGSGMTGVAAMMCSRPPHSLIVSGAQVGLRKAILNDLSPAACHIAYNYTHPADARALKAEFNRIMQELQQSSTGCMEQCATDVEERLLFRIQSGLKCSCATVVKKTWCRGM